MFPGTSTLLPDIYCIYFNRSDGLPGRHGFADLSLPAPVSCYFQVPRLPAVTDEEQPEVRQPGFICFFRELI